jgi:hypothetical protein
METVKLTNIGRQLLNVALQGIQRGFDKFYPLLHLSSPQLESRWTVFRLKFEVVGELIQELPPTVACRESFENERRWKRNGD